MKNLFIVAAIISTVLCVSVFCQDTAALLNNAKAAIDRQDYPAALIALDTIIKREPKNDAAYTQKARIFVRQNKLDLALVEAEKALKINPKNYEALNARGVAKRDHLKDRAGALADFDKAASIKPDYYFAVLNQGITLSMMRKIAAASAAFDGAARIDPKNPAPYYERARLLMAYGRNAEAIPDFDKAVSLSPNNSVYYSARGYNRFRLYLDRKAQITDFKADIDKALELDPKSSLAHSIRSLARPETESEAAATDAQKAIDLNPNNFLGYAARSFVRFNKKDVEGALDDLEKARSLVPYDKWVNEKRDFVLERATSPRAQALKAEIVKAKKDAAEAEVDAAKKNVLEDPWNYAAYEVINDGWWGWTRDGAEFDKKPFWEKLLADNPRNICAMRYLGEFKARDYIDMISYWDSALAMYDGKNGTDCAAAIAFRIGREYSSRNRYNEANTYFARAKELKPDLKYLEGNIAANKERKAEDDKFKAEFAAIRVQPAGTASGGSSSTASKKPKPSPCTAPKTQAAVSEYERVHNSIEYDISEHNQAVKKYVDAGGYRRLYQGTYQRIQNIEARIVGKIGDLLKKHGECLPGPLRSHIVSDQQKVLDLKIPGPWEF